MLSPHPADPTLTTDNLMEVLKGVEDRWWDDLALMLGVTVSKREKIRYIYRTNHQRMEALVDDYITLQSAPSWQAVARALQVLKLHKQADEVTTKYVKGIDVNHLICWILSS